MIKIKQVSKKINGRLVLDRIDFEVKDGEILGLVGPNGAGKTTLLNIIAGIWPPDSGEVEIDGVEIGKREKETKQKIGYIPDIPFLYPRLTGREFLSFVGKLYQLDAQTLEEKTGELAVALELAPWLDELMEGYPRGVRQKMTFAGMLLHSPKILLLDEPLTNLDPKSSRLVKEILQNKAKAGAAILLSTHILEIAEKLCRSLVLIHGGKKICAGTLEELRASANSPGSNLEEVFLKLVS